MRRYDGAVLVGECRFRNGPNLKIRRERGVPLLMAVVEGEDVDVAVGLWLDAQGGADDAAHSQPVVDDGRHSVLPGEEDTGRLRARRGGTRLEPNGNTEKSMLIQSKATDRGLLPARRPRTADGTDGRDAAQQEVAILRVLLPLFLARSIRRQKRLDVPDSRHTRSPKTLRRWQAVHDRAEAVASYAVGVGGAEDGREGGEVRLASRIPRLMS